MSKYYSRIKQLTYTVSFWG